MNEKSFNELTPELRERLGRVAVVYGGHSAERSVSLKSGAAVIEAFKKLGIDFKAIDLQGDIQSALAGENIDRVFLILHGVGGEDGTVQGALENMGLPYTGSGVLASALAMDKLRTKQLWLGIGLPTPKFSILNAHTDWQQTLALLGGEVMVKPAHEGSSLGMARVTSAEEFKQAFAVATQYDHSVIAEQWITGNEYTVAILGDAALPVIKLETANKFYDFEAKYISNDTRYLIPCGLDRDAERALQQLALQAFNSLGCRGWGRVDVMQDKQGNFYLLEVNTLPGMTDHSLVPMAAKANQISFEALVLKIVMLTLD